MIGITESNKTSLCCNCCGDILTDNSKGYLMNFFISQDSNRFRLALCKECFIGMRDLMNETLEDEEENA